MNRFWILDLRFWICRNGAASSSNPKSKIQNPKWFLFGLLLPSCLLAAAAPTPTPTPTARPRLGGGFGRAVSTPVPRGATGQSLADVVRAAETVRNKEKENPEKKSAVKIDNNTLVTDPSKGKLTTAKPAPAAAARPAAPPAAPAAAARASVAPTPAPPSPAPGEPSAEETRWREAARNGKKRIEDARNRVEELDSAAHKLESDFYAWDDGQYRDRVIKPAWDKTKEDLEAARKELAAAEKDLAELPDRARRAGALPGWLRE